MERFMVVYFTEPQGEGSAMPEWYQHMTVVPWAEGDMRAATTSLATVLAERQPFAAHVSEPDMFGPQGNIPVFILEPRTVLRSLHEAVLDIVCSHARLAVDHEFVGASYVPHITPKPGQPERAVGDPFLLDRVTVVQRLKGSRSIYKNVPLGHEAAA